MADVSLSPLTSICLSRTRRRVDKRASNLFVLGQTAYARPTRTEKKIDRENHSICARARDYYDNLTLTLLSHAMLGKQ